MLISKKFKKFFTLIFVNIIIISIFVEVLSYFYLSMYISSRPTYIFQKRHHYGDYNKFFGAWHLPSSKYRHKKKCFDVSYSFNKYGARDKERNIESKKNRTLILGDSVVEGYGLKNEDRFSNLLEKETGIEHLNFGTSGHFGTTQYFLIYKHLASNFSHNKVIVFYTATNDIEDDSFEFGKKIHNKRYRPYLISNGNEYKIKYFNKKKLGNKINYKEYFKDLLMNYTNFYHVLRFVYSNRYNFLNSINTDKKNIMKKKVKLKSYLYNFSKKDIEIIKHNLKQIKIITNKNNAKLYLALTGHRKEYYDLFKSNTKPPLIDFFEKNQEEIGYEFIDLFENTFDIKNYNNIEKYFFDKNCDNHHNASAHKIFSKKLRKIIYEQKSN
jgi:hypothetical protein